MQRIIQKYEYYTNIDYTFVLCEIVPWTSFTFFVEYLHEIFSTLYIDEMEVLNMGKSISVTLTTVHASRKTNKQ